MSLKDKIPAFSLTQPAITLSNSDPDEIKNKKPLHRALADNSVFVEAKTNPHGTGAYNS